MNGAPIDPSQPWTPYPGGTANVGQRAGPETLGSVTQAAQGGNDLLQRYRTALQAANEFVAPAMGQMDPPSILKNILSFGGAGADYDATQRWNAKLKAQAAEIAMHLADSQANADALSGRNAMQQLNFQARLLGLEDQIRNHQYQQVRGEHADNMKYTRRPAPKTAAEADALEQGGFEPDPENPSFWRPKTGAGAAGGGGGGVGPRLAPRAGGGWDLPANAPAKKALDAVDGGGGAGGDQGDQGKPLSQRLAENEAKRKTMVPTTQTRQRSEAATDVVKQVAKLRTIMQGMSLGPFASRVRSARTALGFSDPRFKKYETEAGLLQTKLANMHVGARGSDRLVAKFQKMIDTGVQSPENMNAALDAIDDYAKDVQAGGELKTDIPGLPTKTTQPTEGTGGGTLGVTPGGTRYRVLP